MERHVPASCAPITAGSRHRIVCGILAWKKFACASRNFSSGTCQVVGKGRKCSAGVPANAQPCHTPSNVEFDTRVCFSDDDREPVTADTELKSLEIPEPIVPDYDPWESFHTSN